ncbi:hypothetical protein pb186bvf_020834 [Paramecium bursaria]
MVKVNPQSCSAFSGESIMSCKKSRRLRMQREHESQNMSRESRFLLLQLGSIEMLTYDTRNIEPIGLHAKIQNILNKLLVTTPGKACVWEDQGFDFTNWDFDMVCQYNDLTQNCKANKEQIDGCGENLQINAPRCAAYTTENCFFLHSHCREIQDQNYLDYVLNRVQWEILI